MQRPHHPAPNAPAAATGMSQQQQQQPLGFFRGAPASKLILIMSILFYVFIHAQKAASLVGFDSYRMSSSSNSNSEYYRYWTSQWCFGSTGELVTGTLLLAYWMRPLEREMGTRKYVMFVLVLLPALVLVLQWVVVEFVLVLWNALTAQTTSATTVWQYSGPYPLLGAHLAWFYLFVPRLHPRFLQILGMHFSEKAMIYLWCCQVIQVGRWHTVAATAVGVAAWAVYYKFLAELVVVPNSVATTTAMVLARWMDPPQPILVATAGRGAVPRHAAAAAAVAAQRAPPAQPVAPDPAAMEQLTGMGFGRAQVVEALQATNNHVQRAADRLLSQQ